MSFDRGALVLVNLDPVKGHEQRGVRPCIVVSDPEIIADQRFPLLAVVPVTGTPGEGSLYPELRPMPDGLSKVSYALIDHLRSIDKRRIGRVYKAVRAEEIAAIDRGLRLFLGLSASL